MPRSGPAGLAQQRFEGRPVEGFAHDAVAVVVDERQRVDHLRNRISARVPRRIVWERRHTRHSAADRARVREMRWIGTNAKLGRSRPRG
ncbi:hypothetical protein GCM10027068_11160 [Prescottella soli]